MIVGENLHQDLIVGEDLAQGDKVGLDEPNIIVRRTDAHALFGVAGEVFKAGARARLRDGWRVESARK